ncbi:MAG: DNA-binding protein [Pigmentiphaga sp.]
MTEIKVWDAAAHLPDQEAVAAYLTAALETGDAKLVQAALRDVLRSEAVAKAAVAENMSCPEWEEGEISFAMFLGTLHGLDLRLVVQPI